MWLRSYVWMFHAKMTNLLQSAAGEFHVSSHWSTWCLYFTGTLYLVFRPQDEQWTTATKNCLELSRRQFGVYSLGKISSRNNPAKGVNKLWVSITFCTEWPYNWSVISHVDNLLSWKSFPSSSPSMEFACINLKTKTFC